MVTTAQAGFRTVSRPSDVVSSFDRVAVDEDGLPHLPLTAFYARWQVELLFKRIKQLLRLHGVPSGAYSANEAFLAWSLVGWALLDRQVEHMGEHLPRAAAGTRQCW